MWSIINLSPKRGWAKWKKKVNPRFFLYFVCCALLRRTLPFHPVLESPSEFAFHHQRMHNPVIMNLLSLSVLPATWGFQSSWWRASNWTWEFGWVRRGGYAHLLTSHRRRPILLCLDYCHYERAKEKWKKKKKFLNLTATIISSLVGDPPVTIAAAAAGATDVRDWKKSICRMSFPSHTTVFPPLSFLDKKKCHAMVVATMVDYVNHEEEEKHESS